MARVAQPCECTQCPWTVQLNIVKTVCFRGFPGSSAAKESTCSAGDPSLIPGSGRSPGEGIGYQLHYSWASLVAQLVKNLPAVWETWVWSLGWEGPLEKGKATHSSILAWRIPSTIQSMGSQRVGHDWVTLTFTYQHRQELSNLLFSLVQSLSCVQLLATPWTAVHQASLSITNSQSPPRPMSIKLVMPSSHLILCRPLLLLPSIFQHQGLFQWVSSPHQVAKVLEFQLQHQSFQWTPRTDLL